MVSKTMRVKEIGQRKRRLSRQARKMEDLSGQAEEEVPMEGKLSKSAGSPSSV